ncbi:MAG: FecR family protein [Candidatus Bathyarchaeota archaeon]|nr:FecR family protein [Candidatus Bathyarchaeota archaeon]
MSLIPEAMFFASAASSVTYNGVLSLTTTAIYQPDQYNYPDQKITRTCAISCPFSDLTLISYEAGHYSGTIYSQQASYTSDWVISPESSTSSVGVTRTYAPSSGHTSGTFMLQIYGEISGGVLTFLFSPSTSILQLQISTTNTYSTSTSPPGAATAVSYSAPSADAYQVLDSFCNTASSLVNVPKSSTPFQTTQTVTFSGSKIPSDSATKSYEWTGTISLNVGNQVTETSTPIPIINDTSTDNGTNPEPPVVTDTPTPTPIVIPSVPGAEAANIAQIQGDVQIVKAGSTNAEHITGSVVLHDGDTVRTGPNSRVTITYSDGSKFDLKPNSEVVIQATDESSQSKDVSLKSGLIHLWEQIKAGGKKFKVHAIDFVMTIRGSELTVALDDAGAITVTVIDGGVDVQNLETGASVTLEAGQTLTATSGATTQQMQDTVQTVDVSSIDRWWNQPYQNTFFAASNIAIIIAVAIILVVVVVLGVKLIHKRRGYADSATPLPPPPPPPIQKIPRPPQVKSNSKGYS